MCSTKVSFLRCFVETRNCEQKFSSFWLLTLDLYPLGRYKCSKLVQCRVFHVVTVLESSMSLPLSAMPLRIAKIFLAILLSFTFTFSLWKIIICFHEKYISEIDEVNFWLEDNDLGQYKALFGELGKQIRVRSITTDITNSSICVYPWHKYQCTTRLTECCGNVH